MTLALQPICVATARGQDSFLVLDDDCLVAVLVRLSAEYGEDAGNWFYEAGFGPLDGPDHPTFTNLDDATDYVQRRLASHLTWGQRGCRTAQSS
jgi:hypothetical protein